MTTQVVNTEDATQGITANLTSGEANAPVPGAGEGPGNDLSFPGHSLSLTDELSLTGITHEEN